MLQLRKLLPTMLKVYVPTLMVLGTVAFLSLKFDIPVPFFTRDPLSIVEAPFYFGFLSNMGILLWCSCAAICFFSFGLLRRNTTNREITSFCLSSAVVTSFLLMDDLFLFHEVVFPQYLNIDERIVFLAYGIMFMSFLLRFRTVIIRTDLILLFFAVGFFVLSLLLDHLDLDITGYYLFEDGFKLFGIVSWTTYFTREGVKAIKEGVLSGSGNFYSEN